MAQNSSKQKGIKNALIIFNPASGGGNSKETKSKIVSIAKKLGWEGRIIETTLKKSATKISANAVKKGITHIVVCGGDGTILEVLQSIINTNVSLGIVALGTGNLFARNLNIDKDLEQMLRTAFKGSKQTIDVGLANGAYFAIMAGIGFDAEIMRKTGKESKDKFGFLAYLITGLTHFFKPQGIYQVVIDNQHAKTYKARSVMVANMRKIQGGINVVPSANPENGKLAIGIIKASGLYSWLSLLINAVKGNINKSPHYTLLTGKHIEIKSLTGKKPYECDGNHFKPVTSLVIDIYPSSLDVLLAK